MLFPRVIPVLLLRHDGLVKTIKFDKEKYVGDPINALRIFNEKEVDELIFLDIMATIEGREPCMDIIRDIASECFMPVCYGGGIKTLSHIERVFSAGIEKVAINASSLEHPAFIESVAQVFGSQSIVVSLDVRKGITGKYTLYTHRGRKRWPADPTAHAIAMQNAGAGELLINSIDRDGNGKGYDLDLVRRIASSVTIPVIACGGAGTLQHLAEGMHAGASAVAAGSFFVFHGKHRAVLITYPTSKEVETLFGSIFKPQYD